jgi:uncharacterized protein Yka (UPF0111/DUF47 family)
MHIRDLILPEDKVFFTLFTRMAETISEAATTLNEITHELPQGTEKSQKVHQLEHKADEITRHIYEKLNESLITPLEPEEISRLAPVLDDVMDRIDRVTQQICTYGLTEQNEKLREFSFMILLATAEIEKAFKQLPEMQKVQEIRDHANEINRLYNRGIELQSAAVLEIFRSKDLLLIIKLKDIYEGLGLVMEKCNDVGHALNDIILNHT